MNRETPTTDREKELLEEVQALRTKIKTLEIMIGFKKEGQEHLPAYARRGPSSFPNQDEGHVA